MLNKHRGETFLMLDLHAVENATVGIDADEKILGRFELAQNVGWIAHKNFRGKSRRPNQNRVKQDLKVVS